MGHSQLDKMNAAKLTTRVTVSQAINQSNRENDNPENQDEHWKRGQSEMMTGRFTVVEGVPGIWLQHIRSMLYDAASLNTLGLKLLRETNVTGQGLRDMVDSVHLQIGLI